MRSSEHALLMAEIAGEDEWRSHLIVNHTGTAKSILANAITALRRSPDWAGVLAFNQFSLAIETLAPAPWPGPAKRRWTDHEDRLAADWLQRAEIFVSIEIAAQAIQVVAQDQCFHPVR